MGFHLLKSQKYGLVLEEMVVFALWLAAKPWGSVGGLELPGEWAPEDWGEHCRGQHWHSS